MRKPQGQPGVEPAGKPDVVPTGDQDLDEIIAIEREAFNPPWLRAHFLYEIHDNPYARNYVLRSAGGRVLGYVFTWELEDELLINNIAVHRDYRKKGLGKLLVSEILERGRRNGCRAARLDVRPSNRPAVELYSGLGFRVIGIRKGYYGNGREDGWVMVRSLLEWPERGRKRAFLKDDFP